MTGLWQGLGQEPALGRGEVQGLRQVQGQGQGQVQGGLQGYGRVWGVNLWCWLEWLSLPWRSVAVTGHWHCLSRCGREGRIGLAQWCWVGLPPAALLSFFLARCGVITVGGRFGGRGLGSTLASAVGGVSPHPPSPPSRSTLVLTVALITGSMYSASKRSKWCACSGITSLVPLLTYTPAVQNTQGNAPEIPRRVQRDCQTHTRRTLP
ncbi:unnamed protein product, partial [Discosporangium mesarthrocarpum]